MAEPTDTESPDDLSQGYCIELHVKGDGTFVVDDPEPEADETQEESGEPATEGAGAPGEQPAEGATGEQPAEGGEPLPNIGQALRAILKLVEAHPIGQSPQKNFEAGYATGPHMM